MCARLCSKPHAMSDTINIVVTTTQVAGAFLVAAAGGALWTGTQDDSFKNLLIMACAMTFPLKHWTHAILPLGVGGVLATLLKVPVQNGVWAAAIGVAAAAVEAGVKHLVARNF